MRNMLIADYLYNFFHFDLMAQYGQSSFLTELFSGHDLFNGSVFSGQQIILPDELEDLDRETDILIMHSERVMKDMKNSRKGTRINMCKALEDIYEEGREEGRRETAINLSELGVPVETIASAVAVSVKEVQEWIADSARPV